jgi:hypothetical protein
MADDHHRGAIEASPPTDDGCIVPEGAIAMQLDPVRKCPGDIVEGEGAPGVSREQDLIERSEVPEGLLLKSCELGPEFAKILGDIHPFSLGEFKQAIDLLLKFDHIPFELEVRCVAQWTLG